MAYTEWKSSMITFPIADDIKTDHCGEKSPVLILITPCSHIFFQPCVYYRDGTNKHGV